MKNIYKYTKYIVPSFIILSVAAYFIAYKYLAPEAYIKVNNSTKANISWYQDHIDTKYDDFILVNDFTYSDRYMLNDATLHIDGNDYPIKIKEGMRIPPTYNFSDGISINKFGYLESSIYSIDKQMLNRIRSAKNVSMTYRYSDGVDITKKVNK